MVRLHQKGSEQKTQRKASLVFPQFCPLGYKELLGGEKNRSATFIKSDATWNFVGVKDANLYCFIIHYVNCKVVKR